MRDTMTTVLIVIDEVRSLRNVEAARILFGESANYVLVNVARTANLTIGGAPMLWGLGYEFLADALGSEGPITIESPDRGSLEDGRAPSIDATPDLAVHASSPVETIEELAHRHDADVIVVGTRDSGWFSTLFAPSLGGAVVQRADRHVLVVK
jgi:nucleotide-binding universal stress UspA family protein